MEKKKRDKILEGKTVRHKTACGNIYITLNTDKEGSLHEVFATLGKAGGCATCQNEALTRSITLGLRYGVPVGEYAKELSAIQCPNKMLDEGEWILSCAHAISVVLKSFEEGKK